MKGFDCATPISNNELAKAFKDAGYDLACRYLVPSGWKRLTKEEAVVLTDNGLQILSVFETTADRALGGRSAGLYDGQVASLVAHDIGQPEGSCIYFAVDFDATDVQMPYIIDYIRGCSEATPAYSTGVYGSFKVVNAMRDASACSHYWQTYAWSRGLTADFMNVYQYQNDVTENGIGIDLNESYGNEGAWNLNQPIEEDDNMLALNSDQWDALVMSLQRAYDGGVLGDYRFVDKAISHTLTRSELDVANNIILVYGAIKP